mgnify:CR=1 FL=1
MGKEIELKFEVSPQDLRKLKVGRALHGRLLKEESLVSVYFDTPKHKLARTGVTLRVRHNGGKRVQTAKSCGSQGSFRRGEWEHEIAGDVPEWHKARGSPLGPLLTKKVKRKLKPIFETRIHRISVPVRKDGSRIEVALDEGHIRAGRRSTSVTELSSNSSAATLVTCSSWRGKWRSLCPQSWRSRASPSGAMILSRTSLRGPLVARKSSFNATLGRWMPFASSDGQFCGT